MRFFDYEYKLWKVVLKQYKNHNLTDGLVIGIILLTMLGCIIFMIHSSFQSENIEISRVVIETRGKKIIQVDPNYYKVYLTPIRVVNDWWTSNDPNIYNIHLVPTKEVDSWVYDWFNNVNESDNKYRLDPNIYHVYLVPKDMVKNWSNVKNKIKYKIK